MLGAQTSLWSDLLIKGYGSGGGEVSVFADAVSLWKLDEASGTRADSIGSNDLTDNNTVLYANMGPAGTVADFEASASEMLDSADTDFNFSGNQSFTLAGWFKNEGASTLNGLFGKWTGGDRAYAALLPSAARPVWRIQYADDSTNSEIAAHASTPAFNDGQWHFLVCWHDAAADISGISVDDISATTAHAAGVATSAQNFEIGGSLGAGVTWDGLSGRVGVWNVALSSTERTSLYNAGKGKAYAELTTAEKVGLISYYALDEASGDRADSHGSNTLTDNNTVTSVTNSYPANLPGRVASFVAANSESLTRADEASLSLGADSEFTFSLWLNTTQIGALWQALSKWSAAGTNEAVEYNIGQAFTSDILFRVGNGSSSGTVDTANISINTWYLVVVWHDPAANKLYIQLNNGTPVEAAWSGGTQDGTGTFAIGRAGSNASNYFNGIISCVARWDRILTDDERTALYNSGDGASLP